MFCTKCGNQLSDDTRFCNECGTPVARPSSVQPSQAYQSAPEAGQETSEKDEIVHLIWRAMQGDNSVWGPVYEKTHRYVYYMAIKFLRSEQDAQDVTQEVYIQAIRSIVQLYSADSFFGWLRSIVYSKCKDLVKKKKPALLDEDDISQLEETPDFNDDFLPDAGLAFISLFDTAQMLQPLS